LATSTGTLTKRATAMVERRNGNWHFKRPK
jgi:hypothetical protein